MLIITMRFNFFTVRPNRIEDLNTIGFASRGTLGGVTPSAGCLASGAKNICLCSSGYSVEVWLLRQPAAVPVCGDLADVETLIVES